MVSLTLFYAIPYTPTFKEFTLLFPSFSIRKCSLYLILSTLLINKRLYLRSKSLSKRKTIQSESLLEFGFLILLEVKT